MSKQIDVVVLKPFYPPKLRKNKIWLASGVAAAFECKTTLQTSHITNERCSSFKTLFPRQIGSPARELRSSLIYGVLAHSHPWKQQSSTPVANVHKALMKAVDSANHPSDIIDLVCIAALGCWSGMMMPCYPCDFRSDGSAIPKDPAWGPKSIMLKATISGDNQHQTFQPIGAMLAYLTKRLARNDPSIRDLADYYRLAGLWGQGSGQTRHWPKSTLSGIVQQAVEAGELSNNGDGWSEWQAMFV